MTQAEEVYGWWRKAINSLSDEEIPKFLDEIKQVILKYSKEANQTSKHVETVVKINKNYKGGDLRD